MLFQKSETIELKEIVAVDVRQGTERPYYIAKKEMRPEGVYIRQGYSSAPATNTAIRRMVEKDALEQHGKGGSVKDILPEEV